MRMPLGYDVIVYETHYPLRARVKLTGEERLDVLADVAHWYREEGRSIRDIAKHVGRSYGSVHALLKEAGVAMREPGSKAQTQTQTLKD
jgi:transposase